MALQRSITAAATLHAGGVTNIETSSQAAEALRPVAGAFALAVFTFGKLSAPACYGAYSRRLLSLRNWRGNVLADRLSRRPLEARAFYTILAPRPASGILMNFIHFDPIRAPYWAAVINGIIAVPVMTLMMLMARDKGVMGDFIVPATLNSRIGWIATVVACLAVIGLIVTSLVSK